MKIGDWNPKLYLKFKNERTQPSIDLVNRIHLEKIPSNIIDIGCGPGNSTQILVKKWPKSSITGLDNSASMIEKAKKDYPGQDWILSDAATFKSEKKYDVVFSNATIQWIPEHKKLLKVFIDLVSEKGVLAVQIPLFRDLAIWKAIESVSKKTRWAEATKGCAEIFTYHDIDFYYNVLSANINAIEMWKTTYIHIMISHSAILDWSRSTALRPYLDRMKQESEKNEFEKDLLSEIKREYPMQTNGKVLFPFKRLFFIAYKQHPPAGSEILT